MSLRQFNPKAFFRKVRPELRDRLLGNLNLLDLIQQKRKQDDPENTRDYFAWRRIPKNHRQTADRDLMRINDMCSETARFYLDQASQNLWSDNPDALKEAEDMTNHDLAATIFLQSKAEFNSAYGKLVIDDYSFRVKRRGRGKKEINPTKAMREELQERITNFFSDNHQGYRRCLVEDLDEDKRFALFVYHELRLKPEDRFDKGGALVTDWRKPVELGMAVYYHDSNVLLVKAKEKKLRDFLIEQIGAVYFGDPMFFNDTYVDEFDLSPLLDPNFSFSFRHTDGIGHVQVSEISFHHPDSAIGLVTAKCPHGHLAAINGFGVSLQRLHLVGVKIEVKPDGHKYKRQRTIAITLPDRVNLADTPRDRMLIRYLDEWKLTRRDADDELFDWNVVDAVERQREHVHARIAARYQGGASDLAR